MTCDMELISERDVISNRYIKYFLKSYFFYMNEQMIVKACASISTSTCNYFIYI